MKSHANTILISFATGVLLLISGSMYLVAQEEKTMETQYIVNSVSPSSIIIGEAKNVKDVRFSGGVSGNWLTVQRHNLKDYEERSFDPSFTSVLSDFKPIVKRLGKNSYEITFESDLP